MAKHGQRRIQMATYPFLLLALILIVLWIRLDLLRSKIATLENDLAWATGDVRNLRQVIIFGKIIKDHPEMAPAESTDLDVKLTSYRQVIVKWVKQNREECFGLLDISLNRWVTPPMLAAR